MDILSPCLICGNPFSPRNCKQKICLPCNRKPCPQCGGNKEPDARLCKRCLIASLKGSGKWPTRKVPLSALACVVCSATFIPRDIRQTWCLACAHKPCEACGVKKISPSPLCRKCAGIDSRGKPNLKNRRPEKPIEQIVSEAEAFGLVPEKQYAFGYVMGVVFGDGCAYKVTNRIPHTRSDGVVTYHLSTTYLIKLSVISEAFAHRFASKWGILSGKPIKVSTYTRTNFSKSTLKGRRDEYSVKLFNVNPGHMLLGRYFTYRKYECDPSFLLKLPLEAMLGFVHGMIDSEGYVKGRRADIANKKVDLLDAVAVMLKQLGYKATVYTYPSNSVSHLVTYMDYVKFDVK